MYKMSATSYNKPFQVLLASLNTNNEYRLKMNQLRNVVE